MITILIQNHDQTIIYVFNYNADRLLLAHRPKGRVNLGDWIQHTTALIEGIQVPERQNSGRQQVITTLSQHERSPGSQSANIDTLCCYVLNKVTEVQTVVVEQMIEVTRKAWGLDDDRTIDMDSSTDDGVEQR